MFLYLESKAKLTRSIIFGPIWTQFRSKQLKIWPGSYFYSWIGWIISNRLNQINQIKLIKSNRSNQIDQIKSIKSNQSNQIDQIKSINSNQLQKWLPGQIFSCLDLNWLQIGPKMAKIGRFWVWKRTKMSILAFLKAKEFDKFCRIFRKIIKFLEG